MVTGTETARKGKARKRNTIGSSSSGKAVKSKQRVNVSVVGTHIERELDLAGSGDTLARWMAHRIAELIGIEANAGSAGERAAAKKQTQALILELWAMRAALPGRVDPAARLKGAIDVLEKLSSNERYFYQHRDVGERSEQEALKAHHNISRIVSNLALVKLANDSAEYDGDEANLPLSDDELKIRQLLDEAMASGVSRRIFITSPNDQPAEKKSNVDLLCEKIDAAIDEAVTSLSVLKESMGVKSNAPVVTDRATKRKRAARARSFGKGRKSI